MRTAARDESGAIFIITAIAMITMLCMVGLVIDVANWREHKRHLQGQVDAGAFAAGSRYIIPDCATVSAQEAAVSDVARQFAGETGFANAINPQVSGGTTQIRINSANYPDRGGANFDIAGPSTTTGPCTLFNDFMITDVKATEENVGGFFSALGLSFLPDIRARARVRLEAVSEAEGAIPLGIPDLRPTDVWAQIHNECSGADSPPIQLTRSLNQVNGVYTWSSALFNHVMPSTCPSGGNVAETIRVLVRTGSAPNPPPPACGDPLVLCYDGSSPGGLYYLHGWQDGANPDLWTGGAPTTTFLPEIQDVSITGGSCGAAPNFTTVTTNCTYGVSAFIEFGNQTDDDSFLLTDAPGKDVNITVNAVTSSGTVAMTRVANTNEWVSGPLTASATGPNNVSVNWSWRMEAPNCSQTLDPTGPDGSGRRLVIEKTVVNDNCGGFTQDDFWFTVDGGAPQQWEPDGRNVIMGIAADSTHTVDEVAPFNGYTTIPTSRSCTVTFGNGNNSRTCPFENNDPVSAGTNWRGLGCTNGVLTPCRASGSFGVVQSAFKGDTTRSGPVASMGMSASGPLQSARAGSTVNGVVIAVGLGGSINLDPSVQVRIRLGDPQSNQMLDCDPGNPPGQRNDEVAEGCPTIGSTQRVTYAVNTLLDPFWFPCGASNWLHALYPSETKWRCVDVTTGLTPSQVDDGFERRTKNVTGCNNPNYFATHFGDLSALDPRVNKSDPRRVRVFIVPYGSFDSNGSNLTEEVIGFATFYITGWRGNGPNSDPCAGVVSGPSETTIQGTGLPLDEGDVVGHFFQFVEAPGTGGTGSGEPCKLDTPTPCIAVLVE